MNDFYKLNKVKLLILSLIKNFQSKQFKTLVSKIVFQPYSFPITLFTDLNLKITHKLKLFLEFSEASDGYRDSKLTIPKKRKINKRKSNDE